MTDTTTTTLHFSPLLPVEPDWQTMATECAQAWIDLQRINDALNKRDVAVDGMSFWQAHHRMEAAASAINLWSEDPHLYGRLLARDNMLKDMEAEQLAKLSMCFACERGRHDNCKHAMCQCPYVCPNVADRTPRVGCCEQCRYELGV